MEKCSTLAKNILLLLVLDLALSGCVKPQQKDPSAAGDSSNASFTLGEVSADAQDADVDPIWRLPKAKLVNFHVAAQDRRTKDSVRGHKFTIISEAGEQSAVSDVNGQLSWSEKIAFNPFAQDTYVTLPRSIRADGMHVGVRKVELGFNPWQKGDVVDLKYKHLPEEKLSKAEMTSLRLLGKADSNTTTNLVASSMKILSSNVGITKDASDFHFTIDIKPAVATVAANQTISSYALEDGQFKVALTYFNRTKIGDNTQSWIFLKLDSGDVVRMTGGHLSIEKTVSVSQLPLQGENFVAVRIEPINAPIGLKTYEAVYGIGATMGDWGSSMVLKPELSSLAPNFVLSDYLAQIANTKISAQAMETVSVKADPFKVMRLTPSWNGVDIQQETPTTRSINFDLTACVQNINGVPLSYQKFSVTGLAGQEVPIKTTDNAGCFVWAETAFYKIYKPETFIEGVVKIRNAGGHEVAIKVAVNPWNSGFRAATDLRYKDPDNNYMKNIANQQKHPLASIYMNSFSWETQSGMTYEVDEFLNLRTVRPFQFTLTPTAPRLSNTDTGIVNTDNLRPGFYLLRVAIEKELVENENLDATGKSVGQKRTEHIKTLRKIVALKPGSQMIVESIPLEFDDVRLTRLRNNIMFELVPIDYTKLRAEDQTNLLIRTDIGLEALVDNDSGLVTQTFVGTFVPMKQENSAGLRPAAEILGVSCIALDCIGSKETSKDASKVADKIKDVKGDGKAKEYWAKAPDSLIRFAKMSFNELEKREKAVRANNRLMYAQLTPITEVIRRHNVEFVTLKNEQSLYAQNLEIANMNLAIGAPAKTASQALIESLNAQKPPLAAIGLAGAGMGDAGGMAIAMALSQAERNEQAAPKITEKDLEQVIAGGTVTGELSRKLCYYWVNEFLPKNAQTKAQDLYQPMSLYKSVMSSLSNFGTSAMTGSVIDRVTMDLCNGTSAQGATAGSVAQTPFVVQPMDRILGVDKTEYPGGWSVGFDMGTSFSVSHSQSDSWSISSGAHPIAAGAALAGLVSKSAQNFLKGNPLFAIALEILGASVSVSDSTSKSTGSSSSFGSHIGLNVDTIPVDLTVSSYESCATVRLRPEIIEKLSLRERLNSKIVTEEVKSALLSRGILLCSGEPIRTAKKIREYYYSFVQSLPDGAAQDPYSFENQPRSLFIRGRNDYAKMINLLKDKASVDDKRFWQNGDVDITTDANNKATMSIQAFTPTYPGMYTP